jgi:pimeloyl-ACP methyl ester carboxylesterase
MPVWIAGMIGALWGQVWGYALFGVSGAIQLYVNLFLWFFEREYVYPAVGPVAYCTYIWGNFIYWGLQRDPDRFLAQSKETMSEPDGQLLDQPEMAKLFVAGLQEAFRSGVGGANRDATLYTKPWGFRLRELSAEVHLWHGGQDKNVPISVAHHVAKAIPNHNAKFYPAEGHLTLPHNRMREILTTLCS